MTPTNKQLESFFDTLVSVLNRKCVAFHYPRQQCWKNECVCWGVSLISPALPNCNWKNIRILAARFFEHGPDIDPAWKVDACITGFVPEVLHDLLLGIFVGGDGKSELSAEEKFFKARKAMNAALIAASQNPKTP